MLVFCDPLPINRVPNWTGTQREEGDSAWFVWYTPHLLFTLNRENHIMYVFSVDVNSCGGCFHWKMAWEERVNFQWQDLCPTSLPPVATKHIFEDQEISSWITSVSGVLALIFETNCGEIEAFQHHGQGQHLFTSWIERLELTEKYSQMFEHRLTDLSLKCWIWQSSNMKSLMLSGVKYEIPSYFICKCCQD